MSVNTDLFHRKERKRKMKKLMALVLAGAMALSLAACGGDSSSAAGGSSAGGSSAAAGADGKPVVKVAVMSPMSGESARFGEQYKAAIEAAMKVVEEDSMLNDYTLEFEYIDDKGTTDGAPVAANYALDQYGCNVAIGHMLTTMILADGQYFEDAETPLLGIVSGPAAVSQGWQYVSIETGTDITQADTLIDYLVGSQGKQKISLINVNTEGGMTAAEEIERYLKEEYDLELATHDQMSNEDTDFTSVALNMKEAGTDCVIFWGLNQANGQLCYNAVKQYVGDDVLFAGGTNLSQNQMLTTWDAESIDGVVFPVGYIPEEGNELKSRINEYYKAADPDGNDLTDVPARVVDSIFHLCTALNDLGAKDPTADGFNAELNTALRSAKFEGVQGSFDFGANDNGVGLNVMNIGVWDSEYQQSKVDF